MTVIFRYLFNCRCIKTSEKTKRNFFVYSKYGRNEKGSAEMDDFTVLKFPNKYLEAHSAISAIR